MIICVAGRVPRRLSEGVYHGYDMLCPCGTPADIPLCEAGRDERS